FEPLEPRGDRLVIWKRLQLAVHVGFQSSMLRPNVDNADRWTSVRVTTAVAGAHGSRTHHAMPSTASPVLKTGGSTGTPPLPRHRSGGGLAPPTRSPEPGRTRPLRRVRGP